MKINTCRQCGAIFQHAGKYTRYLCPACIEDNRIATVQRDRELCKTKKRKPRLSPFADLIADAPNIVSTALQVGWIKQSLLAQFEASGRDLVSYGKQNGLIH